MTFWSWLASKFYWWSEEDTSLLQKDFQLDQYTGVWYEHYRSKNFPFESGTDVECVYEAIPNESRKFAFENRQHSMESNEWQCVEGTAEQISETAHFQICINGIEYLGDYRVLYTDYENVSVVYSDVCYLGWFRTKYVWILGRKKEPLPPELMQRVIKLITEGLDVQFDSLLQTPRIVGSE